MKPFSFYPTASGAAKTQPMSASDITRINRIRASSAAYPNIFSNPPKNISNLSLNTSQIAGIRLGNTINNGIFSYRPKIQPIVQDVIESVVILDTNPELSNYFRIYGTKIQVIFTFSGAFTSMSVSYEYTNNLNDPSNNTTFNNFSSNKSNTINLGSNRYGFEFDASTSPNIKINPINMYRVIVAFPPTNYINISSDDTYTSG